MTCQFIAVLYKSKGDSIDGIVVDSGRLRVIRIKSIVSIRANKVCMCSFVRSE